MSDLSSENKQTDKTSSLQQRQLPTEEMMVNDDDIQRDNIDQTNRQHHVHSPTYHLDATIVQQNNREEVKYQPEAKTATVKTAETAEEKTKKKKEEEEEKEKEQEQEQQSVQVRTRQQFQDLFEKCEREYADQLRIVFQAHPDDPNVAAMFASSLMNLAPWRLWCVFDCYYLFVILFCFKRNF